jgi:hypothetical protein
MGFAECIQPEADEGVLLSDVRERFARANAVETTKPAA